MEEEGGIEDKSLNKMAMAALIFEERNKILNIYIY